MAHLDFVRPSGQWYKELVPGATDWQRFDYHQSLLVNGDVGGTWNPDAPIIVGGLGLRLVTAGTLFTGNVSTATGGRVQIDSVVGNTPNISSATTDVIILSMTDLQAPTGDETLTGQWSWLQDDFIVTSTQPFPVGAQSVYAGQFTEITIPGRYLHAGAQLTKIILHFRVVTRPPTLSSSSPLIFGIIGWNSSTDSYVLAAPGNPWQLNTVYPLHSYVTPLTAQINGYYFKATAISGTGTSSSTTEPIWPTIVGNTVIDNPGPNQITWTCVGRSGQMLPSNNAATYFNDGQPQTLELDLDPAALPVMDVAETVYQIIFSGLIDVFGTTTPLVNIMVHSIELHFGGITLLGFE